jgi:SAM-dependent methyltransferase
LTGGGVVQISILSELGLDISEGAVADAIRPFVGTGREFGPDRWQAEVALRRRRLFKRLRNRLIGGLLGGVQRSTEKVRKEYDTVWSAGYDRYQAGRDGVRFSPWLWKGERILFDAAGAPRFRSLIYAAVIDRLKPRRVLEVGCGDGINLLLLSGAYPETSFAGLELTDKGHQAATSAQRLAALPQSLADYSPLPLNDAHAFQRIDFIQGNACAMPFADREFDLVMTVLSVEQMERVRDAALTEIARVTKGHLLNLEPFREVNATGLRRLNVLSRDYFRGAIADLPRYGLRPLWATCDFPQEALLGSAMVLSRKA